MSSRRKPYRRRVNATGRNDGYQYAKITYAFLRSPAWLSLSGPAARLWLHLRARYNGSNNGRLILSLEEGARDLHLGKATVQAAFKELESKGFVICKRRGHWYGRRASEWAVTDVPIDGAVPTNEWRDWKPAAEGSEKQNAVLVPPHRAC